MLVAAATAAVALSGDGLGAPSRGPLTEVVVTLRAPALAGFGRSLQTASRSTEARRLAAQQNAAVRTVQSALPTATIRWRYHLVLNGFAVVLPRSQVGALAALPGIAKVWPNVRYHALRAADGPAQIGATQLWGPALATAGQGMKIAFVDDGIDAQHPYFDPTGYAYPPGFPKGQTQYTTPKVIVQRAFPAPGETWKYADAPFDPVNSYHATHVAGIAAGDHGARANGAIVSGVAPAAYIGNYKALAVPTPEFGLDGNSGEIAAAIEAAVADGMNVINLSIGEPEVELSRDLVVTALENAARAGVVPVVAAGNDFNDFGYGSVTSPASAPSAIAVAAADSRNDMADFSSGGPTALSLQMKPDVTAPGVDVLSSVPPRQGTWSRITGTSMATPHVAGAVALLKQRHPTWTVEQLKSALEQTGDPVHTSPGGPETLATREGGGMIDLARADNPLLFASPTGLSFGLLGPGASATRTVTLTDAGGGAGTWTPSVHVQAGSGSIAAPPAVTVPGSFDVTATAGASTGDVTGFVVLTRGADTRRIPFWFAVSAPKLAGEKAVALTRPGTYSGTTKGAPSRVAHYRYPTGGDDSYPGPERVYRVQVSGRAANIGVVVLSGSVTPHVVFSGSEDRLAGYTALPVDVNPYRTDYADAVPAAGVVLPAAGSYDLVFDTPAGARPGPFTFRYWVNDTAPPRLRARAVKGAIELTATDTGSGLDASHLHVQLDGVSRAVRLRRGVARITATRGRHRLVVTAADWQETKNMEDVPPILPNTATLRATIRVR